MRGNRFPAFLLAVLLVISFVSCQKRDDLDGKRVGVCLGWACDYYLSDREDMELLRYDMFADLIVALKYGYVDDLYKVCEYSTS